MIEKTFTNNESEIELVSYTDTKQNIWFKAKDIAKILGYIHTDQALRKHIDSEDKKSYPVKTKGQVRWSTFINESGFYSLVLSSKLETAKKFKHWVTSLILPSIRKYGQYKLFDNPHNNSFKWEMIPIFNAKKCNISGVFILRLS